MNMCLTRINATFPNTCTTFAGLVLFGLYFFKQMNDLSQFPEPMDDHQDAYDKPVGT